MQPQKALANQKDRCAYGPVIKNIFRLLGLSFVVVGFSWGSAQAAAVTDTFSIKEAAGVTTTNYPVQMGRQFLDAPDPSAIPNFPQVGICADATCSTVSQWLTTQADVKNRYASGYTKFSLISFYIPKLNAGANVYFTFRNQSMCNCGSASWESKTSLLGAYGFDAQTTVTNNGVSQTVSARTILTNWDGVTSSPLGPVYYWGGGSVATTLVICDHSGTYDMGFNGKTVRPMFIATFWPITHQVKVRYVGENASSTGWTDQTYSLSLALGYPSPQVVYTNAHVVHAAGSRWTVTENDQASSWQIATASGTINIKRETWVGNVPAPISINHNLAYVAAAKAIPNYDPTKSLSEAQMASDWSIQQQGSSDIYGGSGNCWDPGNLHAWGSPGAHPHVGLEPLWTLKYLYSGDVREQEIARTCSDQGASFSFHFRENATGKNLTRDNKSGCSYQCSVNGQGRILSVSQRPTFRSIWVTYPYTTAADAIRVTGPYQNPNNGYNNAGYYTNDTSHEPDIASAMYLVSGDWFYLEETWFLGSFAVATGNGADPNGSDGRGPTGAEGGVGYNAGEVRAVAWGLRSYLSAAMISPDNTPEKSYFDTLINDEVAQEEGARCTAADIFSWCAASPFHGNANWKWGISTRSKINRGMPYPTLHQWQRGLAQFVQGSPQPNDYGINYVQATGTLTNSGASATVTMSDPAMCSKLKVNTPVEVGCSTDGQWNCMSGPEVISSVSGCTATLAAYDGTPVPFNLSGSAYAAGGSNSWWMYSPSVQEAESQFSADYLMGVLGRGYELGYPMGNLVNWFGQFFVGLITDPGSNPRLAFTGRMPTIDVNTGQYFSSYNELKTGWTSNWQSLTTGYAPAGTDNTPPENYPALAMAATSYLTQLPNGAAAWNFMAANVLPDPGFNSNPHWAVIPRGAVVAQPPPPKNRCDINGDGIVNVADVQLGINQATGVAGCTLTTCNAATVTALVNTTLGASCTIQ